MTCTLNLYTDYLLSSTGPTTATGLSRLLDGALSHDHLTRWLSQTTHGPADSWRQAKPLIRQAEARRPAGEFAVGESNPACSVRKLASALTGADSESNRCSAHQAMKQRQSLA